MMVKMERSVCSIEDDVKYLTLRLGATFETGSGNRSELRQTKEG